MVEFRRECRSFAEHWLSVQREEFKRLGVTGDWDHPYLTMAYPAEAAIARELMTFATTGQLYRGSKPVMWSVVEKTALAEAEVEYEDHVSDTIWAAFPVVSSKTAPDLQGARVVIWTTTPWTIRPTGPSPIPKKSPTDCIVSLLRLKRTGLNLVFVTLLLTNWRATSSRQRASNPSSD